MDIIDTATTEKNKKNLLQALEKSLGIVSTACIKSDLCRQTYYNYMRDPEFARKVDLIQERQIDLVETAMLQKIIEDKNPYLIWKYLSSRARQRGYIERHEQIQIPGAPEDEAGIKDLLEKLATDEDLIEIENKENKLDPSKRIEHKPDNKGA